MLSVRLLALDHFDATFGLPAFQSAGAAGVDVRACFANREPIVILPWQRVAIPTGLSMEIPLGYEIQVRPRSGLSLKSQIIVATAPGTIDSDFRGEVKIILANLGPDNVVISHGDRIAQWVVASVPQIQYQWADSQLSETVRGANGFGSTGMN